MIKAIELIVVVTLMVFSFVVGVKYSDSVKSHAGWLFETKEEEVDLPDLTNENSPEGATVYDSGAVDNGDQMPQEQPMDSVGNSMDKDSAGIAAESNPSTEAKSAAPVADKVSAKKAPVKQ